MSIYEPLIIATTAASGASLAMPREYNHVMSILLAVLGVSAGMYGIHLARQDQLEAALVADMTSIVLDMLSIAKALGLV